MTTRERLITQTQIYPRPFPLYHPHDQSKAAPATMARRATAPLAATVMAPLLLPVVLGAGAPELETLPLELPLALPAAVGIAKPVMLPEKGPGAAVAEAPGPVSAGAVALPEKLATGIFLAAARKFS